MTRGLTAMIAAAVLMGATAAPAAAAGRADSVTLSCGQEQFAAELFSYGNPIRIAGTQQHYIPRSVSVVDPATGGTVVLVDHPGAGQEVTFCTFDVSGVTFSMTGFFTGA